MPHGSLVVEMPAAAALPSDRSGLAPLDEGAGRDISARLQPSAEGRHSFVLDGTVTSAFISEPAIRPEQGQQVQAVAYARCDEGSEYDGELRVMALARTDGGWVINDDDISDFPDDCPIGDEPPGAAGDTAAPPGAGGPGGGVVVAGIAGVVAVGAIVSGVLLLRRRSA
jgi:hypothetical protein